MPNCRATIYIETSASPVNRSKDVYAGQTGNPQIETALSDEDSSCAGKQPIGCIHALNSEKIATAKLTLDKSQSIGLQPQRILVGTDAVTRHKMIRGNLNKRRCTLITLFAVIVAALGKPAFFRRVYR
jgi:hypothetical protein